ncbi:CbtA family protein [Caballeronia insecticola]|nr:CbtA family protein [Caballeronia insecticola]
MVGKLLMRGMLVGVVAGLLAFCFARMAGEPQIERAIAFEAHEAHEHAHAGNAPEPEIVNRETQAGAGLLTGVLAYGAAFGGLFALAFAYAWGRAGSTGARPLAGWLALAAFIALVALPTLKYPANPPSVGVPETIGARTALYFLCIGISVAITLMSITLRNAASRTLGDTNATLAGLLAFAVMAAAMLALLPDIDEVPAEFPATLLWKFRVASIGMQAIIWTVVGAAFGPVAERVALPGAARVRPAIRIDTPVRHS